MSIKRAAAFLLMAAAGVAAAPASADTGVGPGGDVMGTASNVEQVGHNGLFNRGMNAALAIFEDPVTGRSYAYVGNRTDGGKPNHIHPGILVLDVTDPAAPTVVSEIGPPFAGLPGITTRELRVWPEKRLLMVMTFRCSVQLHDCVAPDPRDPRPADVQFPFDIKFFRLDDPAHPEFIQSYVPTSQAGQQVKPHEMFLWIDPKDDDRGLLWLSTPSTSTNPKRPQMMIVDISAVPAGGPVREVAEGNWNSQFEFAGNPANFDFDLSVHSMGVDMRGFRTHLAYLRGEELELDTTKVAKNQVPAGAVEDLNDDLLTPPATRPRWGAGNNCPGHTDAGCSESHSSVQVPGPGKPLVLNTDEVYGTYTDPAHGCPWGWMRLIDTSNPAAPRIIGEYRQRKNLCANSDPSEQSNTSYASHNPTVFTSLALVTWHSAGLQAIDIADPTRPEQAGWFSPAPLPVVSTEDPALSTGPNKVVLWSYPIVKDGLIYAIDIRNGLYVLRYTGPHHGRVQGTRFREGNSTVGVTGNTLNFDQGR